MNNNIQVVLVGLGYLRADSFPNASPPYKYNLVTNISLKRWFRETLQTFKIEHARIQQHCQAVNGNNNTTNNGDGDSVGGHVQGLLLSSVDSIDLFTSE